MPEDFYTAAVLPPLLLVLVFGLLGTTDPGALTDPDASAVQAVIAGLADHALALTVGHALCLGCLALRHRVLTRSPRPVGNGPASGR